MGRKVIGGPVAFMPSDGMFIGAKDLSGIPVGRHGERMSIRIVEVAEYDAGTKICGRASPKPFWVMAFDRPNDEALLDLNVRANGWQWVPSRKEWKFGSEVARLLAPRLGSNMSYWTGAVVPIKQDVTGFGRKDVYCVRPVPMPWESDEEKRRRAMELIANGLYRPPGLSEEMAAKHREDFPHIEAEIERRAALAAEENE